MKKILMIIGGIMVALVLIVGGIFLFNSFTYKKLACKSSDGDITIMYNDKKITGYTAVNASYDREEQQKVVDRVGIEAYLDEFEQWFKKNTSDGTCERK